MAIVVGLFFIMPCTDVYKKIDIRTVSFNVPPQEVSRKGLMWKGRREKGAESREQEAGAGRRKQGRGRGSREEEAENREEGERAGKRE